MLSRKAGGGEGAYVGPLVALVGWPTSLLAISTFQ